MPGLAASSGLSCSPVPRAPLEAEAVTVEAGASWVQVQVHSTISCVCCEWVRAPPGLLPHSLCWPLSASVKTRGSENSSVRVNTISTKSDSLILCTNDKKTLNILWRNICIYFGDTERDLGQLYFYQLWILWIIPWALYIANNAQCHAIALCDVAYVVLGWCGVSQYSQYTLQLAAFSSVKFYCLL